MHAGALTSFSGYQRKHVANITSDRQKNKTLRLQLFLPFLGKHMLIKTDLIQRFQISVFQICFDADNSRASIDPKKEWRLELANSLIGQCRCLSAERINTTRTHIYAHASKHMNKTTTYKIRFPTKTTHSNVDIPCHMTGKKTWLC